MKKKYEIDWNSQWAAHGWNFSDGFVRIHFAELGLHPQGAWRKPALQLAPGPGFGDFSHPTTRLCLKMLASRVAGKHVLDIGCGSGVLSLAAAAFGAKSVYGIDIDPEAILHAQQNTAHNAMQHVCNFGAISEFNPDPETFFVMNMIRSEQHLAWNSLPAACQKFKECITSGVLYEERALYFEQIKDWGWHLLEERREGAWMAFRWTQVIPDDCPIVTETRF